VTVEFRTQWDDEYTGIGKVTIEEDSSGSTVSRTMSKGSDLYKYTFTFDRAKDYTVNFKISGTDFYGNSQSPISGSFIVKASTGGVTIGETAPSSVKKEKPPVCGNNICEAKESVESCSLDCKVSEEPSSPIETIRQAIQGVREAIPQARTSLVPLLIAAILTILVFYIFVL